MLKLKPWRTRIILFLAVLGPGFITANVDNDPNGILTYSQAGAQFGYSLLWTIIPITLALIVVQEMCARMGVVTGKGLSDLIREEFGLRMTFIVMVLLVIVNFGNVIGEFAGIAGSLQLFHLSKYISVPICAVIVWLLAVKGDYKSVEKIFLTASVFYIAYIITGVLAGPSWRTAAIATVKLPPRTAWNQNGYVFMVVSVIGTTIAPWMQFYLQSSIVEKGVTARNYAASRLDVIVGSIFTDVVAWFIIVACAACEGLGLESGVDRKFKEAPIFYWLYTILIAGGAAVVLIPNFPLIKWSVESQVLNGVLLPIVIVLMLLLINRKDLMGEHVNSHWFNVAAWVTAIVVSILSVMLMFHGN